MRRALFLVIAGAVFTLAPFTARLGVVLGSAALVALAVALALAASDAFSAFAVGAGALGALAFGVVTASSPASHALAGAALTALCFAERTSRVRGDRARALHVVATVIAGGVAGAIAMRFSLATLPIHAVAAAVMAVIVALPMVVTAVDPLAHALERTARGLDGCPEVVESLREAADLRRAVDEDLLDPALRKPMRVTWASLARLAEARVRLGRSAKAGPAAQVVARLDRRIADHVAGLRRAYTASDAAEAAVATLHDAGLRNVETAGETLEDVSRAMVEQG